MGRFEDLSGKRFGRLIVVEQSRNEKGQLVWNCMCDCGNKTVAKPSHLKSGGKKSCGCLKREILRERNKKYQSTNKQALSRHPIYGIWIGIKKRCYNKKSKYYKNYGGRGIAMCKGWLEDFKLFYDWALENGWDKKLQIDRIDNDGDYEPNNCRFVTHRENTLNRRDLFSSNSTGYKGVSAMKKGTYCAQISVMGERNWLGVFATIKEALEARNSFILDNNFEHEYKIQEYRQLV